MIVSFYDKNFKGLQNNASLVVDNQSYSLVRRGVDFDSLSCKCEPFTENIQPTFVVVKNDRGNYVYACLAGIPQLNKDNQTEIVGSDLKTMLKSDVVMDFSNDFTDVNAFLTAVFDSWRAQVNQDSFSVQLVFNENVGTVAFEYLTPSADGKKVYDAWTDVFAPYLRYYGLFMTSSIDLPKKTVTFQIGKAMYRDKTVKLWELGIRDYGKWVASVNETQCAVYNRVSKTVSYGYKWMLTSQNAVTTDETKRDIYPIKRKVIWKETDDSTQLTALKNEGNQEALEELSGSMFNENLELSGIEADFETRFNIYVQKGEGLYKSLPCGELHYKAAGLEKVQVGYRFTGLQFLL